MAKVNPKKLVATGKVAGKAAGKVVQTLEDVAKGAMKSVEETLPKVAQPVYATKKQAQAATASAAKGTKHFDHAFQLDKNSRRGTMSLIEGHKRAGEGKTELYSGNVLRVLKSVAPDFPSLTGKTANQKLFAAGKAVSEILNKHNAVPYEKLGPIISANAKKNGGVVNITEVSSAVSKLK